MAQDGGESAKERYLREQREYQDALAAYREVLGGRREPVADARVR